MVGVESNDPTNEVLLFVDDCMVQDIFAGRVSERQRLVTDHFVRSNQMEEGEYHLQTTESHRLEERSFLFLVFEVYGVVKDSVVRHGLLDVQAQFYDESVDFVVAVIHTRDQGGHAPEVLCREHLHRFGTQIAFDVFHLLRVL